MAVKPFTTVTINGLSFIVENISYSYTNVPFDRTEFDHGKLAQVRLLSGVSPIIVQLLGGVPSEITYNCAVGNSYTPRPLTPNSYPSDTNNIKQKYKATKIQISCGQSPETANIDSDVASLFSLHKSHSNLITQFQNRLAIFGTEVPYEQLLSAQGDNIQSLYFTTGISASTPDASLSDVLISEFNYTVEYAIPTAIGGYEVYAGFTATLENRIVQPATAS